MIECNYELHRFEGGKNNTYKPDKIIKKINNVSYIMAPNSFGKSTFLNLIALAFYGHQNTEINEELRPQVKDLLSSENQKIKFNLNITSKDGSIKLIANKEDFESEDLEIFEIANGKKERLTPLSILRKFKFIYDIPKDPNNRIKKFIDEVVDEQNRYGSRISRLRTRILELLDQIRDSKDINQINNLKKLQREWDIKHKASVIMIDKIKKERFDLEDYLYWRMFNELLEEHRTTEQNFNTVSSEKKHTDNVEIKVNRKFSDCNNLAKNNILKMIELFNSITLNVKGVIKNKNLLEAWERINLNKSLEDFKFSDTFYELIVRFKNMLNAELGTLKDEKSNQEAMIYEQLIQVLDNYSTVDLEISVVNKSLKEFLNDLKKALKEKSIQIQKMKNIQRTVDDLTNLEKMKGALEKEVFPELKMLSLSLNKSEVKYTKDLQRENRLEQLKKKLEDIDKKLHHYRAQYDYKGKPSEKDIKNRIGKDIRDLGSLNEQQLIDRLSTLDDDLSNAQSEEKDNERRFKNVSEQITTSESKEEHEYKRHQTDLEKILDVIKLLDTKINEEFRDYLGNIKEKKETKNMPLEQKKYTNEIFAYLGKRLGTIEIHTGEKISVKKIDLFKETIESKNGGVYYLKQMGMGQKQAAYLLGLLSTEDERMLIVMFDEVGMMDENTLKQVKTKLVDLYNRKKLLFGLIVQKKEGQPQVIDLCGD